MTKTLTETARAVLEGQVVSEGIPSITPLSGGVSNPNPVDGSATTSTGNAKTLRPGSKAKEGDPKHNDAEDLGGATPTKLPSENLGAKAAKGKDTSKSSKSSVAAQPAKKLPDISEEEEIDADEVLDEETDEDFELSEELEDFINAALEEGLSEEEIMAAIDENFEVISEDDESLEEDEEVEEEVANAETEVEREIEEDLEIDMSEHVDALLSGENLSEEFKTKATAIFEGAVRSKLEEEIERLEEAYAQALEERVEEIKESLASDVDDYLNYVVENWIEENEVAVESALRSELTEDFISGLRALFAEHYIDLPEEKVSVIEELSEKLAEVESKLNEEIETGVSLRNALDEAHKREVIATVCEGLTDTQAAKLQSLAENVSFSDDFGDKVLALRESYFSGSVKNTEVLDRVEVSTNPAMIAEENIDGRMGQYVKVLGRKLPN
jgi:hypothetical protein